MTGHEVEVFESPADGGPYRTVWVAQCTHRTATGLPCWSDWSTDRSVVDRSAGRHGRLVTA